MKEDLTKHKADVTFGQLVEMIPKLNCQRRKLVNPMEKEPHKGSNKSDVYGLPNICPIMDVWHKRKVFGKAMLMVELKYVS